MGGGANRRHRNLSACLIEACLANYGFRLDRRGDLVNAWLDRALAEGTGVGSSQESGEVPNWRGSSVLRSQVVLAGRFAFTVVFGFRD